MRATGDVLEATFGSRWAMILGALTFAKSKVPYTVRVAFNADDGGGTAVTANAVDNCDGLFRLRALGPLCQRRFAEAFEQLEQAT